MFQETGDFFKKDYFFGDLFYEDFFHVFSQDFLKRFLYFLR